MASRLFGHPAGATRGSREFRGRLIHRLVGESRRPRPFGSLIDAELFLGARVQWADAASYPYSGIAVGVAHTAQLQPLSAVYAYSGVAVTFGKLDAGSYSYQATGPAAVADRRTAPVASSYAYSGAATRAAASWVLPAEAGAYSYDGAATEVRADAAVYAAAGAYALTAIGVSFIAHRRLAMQPVYFSLFGGVGSASRGAAARPNGRRHGRKRGLFASLVPASDHAAFRRQVYFGDTPPTPHVGRYAYTGNSIAVRQAWAAVIAAGSYTATGNDVTLDRWRSPLPYQGRVIAMARPGRGASAKSSGGMRMSSSSSGGKRVNAQ